MPITPVTRHETFLAAAAQGDSSLTPITREEVFLNGIADAVSQGGSAAVETVTGATPTIAAAANTIYKCGEITSLTISSFPATGEFAVIFISGATPTSFTPPESMVMPDDFNIEANTRYEINVYDGYAVVASWAVSADA